ncbi:hypothetical protein [Luteimonas aquatica]|uniref:hypothetical protein n=1 Tax=Luteimonas aquatica TaxID=450364 RepID=UPI001F5A3294|nr:hypothetical protein [Luteimonas aquatica]
MKKLLAATLAIAAIPPAFAGDRWLVYTGGEKPGRIFVAVDETYLDAVPFAEKTYKLETLTILENAKAPDWVSSNMIIDCGRKTLEEKLIQVSPRGGKLTTAPDQPAQPAKNAVGEALIEFACEMGPKDSAQRMKARKANNRSRGWMFLGPVTTADLGDLAWNSMWTDGTRPASTPRSDAELEREMASLQTRRQQALATANAIAAQTVKEDKETFEKIVKSQEPIVRANARRKREDGAVRRSLEPWIGQPEAELLRVWGTPTRTEDREGKRVIDYYKQVVETRYAPTQGCPQGQSPQPVNGTDKPLVCAPIAGPVSWEVTYECTASFQFQDGAIIDYVTKGARGSNEAYSHCARVFGKFD